MADRAKGTAMTPEKWDDVLDFKLTRLMEAQRDLAGAIMLSCPGPHTPVQHRDGKAPWCASCGRTAQGRRVSPR